MASRSLAVAVPDQRGQNRPGGRQRLRLVPGGGQAQSERFTVERLKQARHSPQRRALKAKLRRKSALEIELFHLIQGGATKFDDAVTAALDRLEVVQGELDEVKAGFIAAFGRELAMREWELIVDEEMGPLADRLLDAAHPQ